MKINKLKENWDTFGKVNAQWAVLNKKGKKSNLNEFFKTGEEEIKKVMDSLSKKQIKLNKGKALDFGCGMGRLTQALAPYFKKVYGVDISPSMIGLAKKHNKYPDKCKYLLNDKDNLSIFKKNSFDFIYTNIVLQHMKQEYSLNYIKEFLRILKPKGILLFQIPSKRLISWQTLVEIVFPKFIVDFAKKKIQGAVMDMHPIKKEKILMILKKNNTKILDLMPDKSAGKRFESFKYLVEKIK